MSQYSSDILFIFFKGNRSYNDIVIYRQKLQKAESENLKAEK